jgi:hypothetical protein
MVIGISYNSAVPAVYEWILNGTIEGPSVSADGRLGVGVSNPVQALEVAGSAVVAGTLSAGNPLMFRNALYNGDMRIAQRGTTGLTSGYTLDRWLVSNYGAGGAYFTISQIQSGLANFSNALQLQQSSTSSMFFFLQQSLETRDVVRFQGQPVTVSFWYRIPVSFTGSIFSQLNWSTAVDTALRDAGITYTTAAQVTLTNTTAWTYASFTTFVPSTAQALSVMFTNYPPGGSTVNGAQFQLTGVQLEKGSVATPFEVRPYGVELQLCQRYYQTVLQAALYRRYVANVDRQPITFPPMRVAPTGTAVALGTPTNLSTIAFTSYGVMSGYLDVGYTAAGTGVVDIPSGVNLNLSAEL